MRLTSGRFALAELGSHELKGFAAPVPAWQVVGRSELGGRFAARTAAGLTPLVGREDELALLLDRWRLAETGYGQAVLVSGEPGIGKSRMAQSSRRAVALMRASARPFYQCSPIICKARCGRSSIGLNVPRASSDMTHRMQSSQGLRPCWRQPRQAIQQHSRCWQRCWGFLLGDRHAPQDLSPKEQRSKTLEALVRHLKFMSTSRPVLAVLEDAHWGDPTTLELFDRLVDGIERVPIMLLVTTRPEFSPAWSGRPNVDDASARPIEPTRTPLPWRGGSRAAEGSHRS